MKSLEMVLRWIAIIGVFALPFLCLVVSSSLFFPYITGKNFLFRIIVEVITGAWLALALVNPAYRPKRSWILGTLALFVFILAIADAQGANAFKSFWSNFERMDGWITLIHLLLLTVVAASMLNTEKMWHRFWQMSLCISMLVSVYGFLQIAGSLALGEGGTAGLSARIDATFGNPIYLAAYMLFHIFIGAMLWTQMRAERSGSSRLPFTIWYGLAMVLDTLALLFTGTRGTTLGLIGGAVVAVVVYAFTSDGSARMRRMAVGMLVVVLLLAGGLFAARNTAFVHSVGFLDRLASISLQDATTKARLLNMQIAWQGVKERPLLGWGQENYAIVFDKYYDPRMYAQEPWFDRTHDIIFDWWIAGGTLGLLAYLSIFMATLYVLWRGAAEDFTAAEKSILTGLLAGYFFHNLFVFDNVTSYILFGALLAYIAHRASGERLFASLAFPRSTLPYTALAGVLFVAIVVPAVNLNAYTANRMIIQALGQDQGGLMANLQDFEDAIALQTFGTQEAREQLAQAASQVATSSTIPVSDKQEFVSTAIREMQAQAAFSPLDARFPLFLGAIYDSAGDYTDGATALQKAHELSPHKQSIIFEMASNAQHRGDMASATALFKEAYELDTEDNDARFYYAAALITAGNDSAADALIQPLIASGAAADTRVLAAYIARKEYAKAIPLWKAKIAVTPNDAQSYFTLAAIYYEAGDRTNSIATLQAAAQQLPSVSAQVSSLIQQIKDGTVQI